MTKILYITPMATKEDIYSSDEVKPTYDFDSISNSIIDSIRSGVIDTEITHIKELARPPESITNVELNNYDIFLCDLTTMNPNILYIARQTTGLDKPIIYIHSHESVVPIRLVNERVFTYSDSTLDNVFIDELKMLLESFQKDPSSLKNNVNSTTRKQKAFISYSHKNKSYLDRLMVHLKPLAKKGLLDIWVDTRIKTGDQWKVEIEKALAESSISILLVSADFMASDFIVDDELPPLLSKAEVNGTKILPVIISPCRFSREPTLNRFQAANSPSEPLSALGEDEKEAVYDKLAHDIELSLKNA